MTIKLYNTKTRRKEVFKPIDPENVRMYVCGPTVYERAHIGNARAVIVFDMLFRLLRLEYGEDHVRYVRNFTDIDDKINAHALKTGKSIAQITAQTAQWYLDDMATLANLTPTDMPRATEFIAEMVAMIETLIATDHAYEAEGHVLFRVRSYPDYGTFSGRTIDDMLAGARVEVAPYKDDPMDFVLWKPSDSETPGWPSPWGRGRPGWHIECSAMAHKLLGESFDIHGGGNDLTFPHHENEIAQSCCAHPTGDFARFWMHNEMLQIEGKKMSKSLNNFFTVHDLLERGVPGEVIRFVFLSTHYRKPMDWTDEKRSTADKTLRKWYGSLCDIQASTPLPGVVNALKDDLNVHVALQHCHELFAASRLGELKASLQLLGLISENIPSWAHADTFSAAEIEMLNGLLERRNAARAAKDFATADRIRDGLLAAGVIVRDTADGADFQKSDNYNSAVLSQNWDEAQ